MVKRHAIKAVVRSTHADAAVFALTAASTVVFDLVVAVEIGIVVVVLRWEASPCSTPPAPALSEIIEQFDDRGIAVVLKVASPAHRRLLRTVGALDRLDRAGHVAGGLPAALAHVRKHALRGARGAHDHRAAAPEPDAASWPAAS